MALSEMCLGTFTLNIMSSCVNFMHFKLVKEIQRFNGSGIYYELLVDKNRYTRISFMNMCNNFQNELKCRNFLFAIQ